ncbi:hypothetical protein AMAG_15386 [Allomyces macrogynus ATCC 38327]|uniref:C2 domain-containing protein n=1 Tax=Allomyces macrogynus (strain ATCC 38327) TaxID=578462 RepID=A0A0L0T7C1_ALLM3|nr:hypothetical protein AMAG_15386 [Allomyces macrogynus ATCC 38327]|eukprot:KNE70630.1 hypothetical protein AMAG_15386 [Allomyces macrogynus ATCC 38327]
MATFTEYQIRRYRFIFAQHAEDALVEQERAFSSQGTPSMPRARSAASDTDPVESESLTSRPGSNVPPPASSVRRHLTDQSHGTMGHSTLGLGVALRGGGDSAVKDSSTLLTGSTSRIPSLINAIRVHSATSSRAGRAVLDFKQPVVANYRLTVRELHALLPRFGPPLPHDVVKSIMYRYDSSCSGLLDFEDFLEFLADYNVTLEMKRDAARRLFRLQHGNTTAEVRELCQSLGFSPTNTFLVAALRRAQSEAEFLMFLNLDDPEFLWVPSDSLMRSMLDSGIVSDFVFLSRSLSIRVVEAVGLDRFVRAKRRLGHGIDYATLDPYVRVTVAGQTQQTSALMGTATPQWDQELQFTVVIPPGETHDVVQWVACQTITFELFDFNNEGVLTHGELLGKGRLPLLRALLTVKRPFEVAVPIVCPDRFDHHVVLHVHATDRTQERGAFAKVVDVCPKTEEVWFRKYPEKMKRDLCPEQASAAERRAASLSEVDEDNEDNEDDELELQEYFKNMMEQQANSMTLWNYYRPMVESLHQLFPRRNFAILGLDESNIFRPLTSFVCPFKFSSTHTRHDLARFVAQIPFYAPWTPFSETTHRQLAKLSAKVANLLHHSTQPLANGYGEPVICAESRSSQIATPASMVARGFGSLMEHAILLCSLFLGHGSDAFVAVGTHHGMHRVWVVTVDRMAADDDHHRGLDDAAPLSRRSGSTQGLDVEGFTGRSALAHVTRQNARLKVQHWNLVAGTAWSSYTQSGFAFERVTTVFNHQNVWFNVQRSDLLARPIFSWELNNPACWLPFLSPACQPEFASVMGCFYNPPTQLHDVSLTFPLNDVAAAMALGQLIKEYRKNHLLLTTRFHRVLSLWLRDQIAELEACRLRGAIPNLKNPVELFPPACTFSYRFLRFHGKPSPTAMLQFLVEGGYLDCSVAGCAFAVAVSSFVHPMGARTVWVGVGMATNVT